MEQTYPRDLCAGEAIALMRAVVEECGPTTVYKHRTYRDTHGNTVACAMYASQGEADCMFGRMLERFGVPPNRMAFICHLHIGWALARLHILTPPGLAANLRIAQMLHDIGYEWGVVLDYFERLCMDDARKGVRL